MDGERAYERAYRSPPLTVEHDLYNSYSRPVSSATNIISLYASTGDSSDHVHQMSSNESYGMPSSSGGNYETGLAPVASGYVERSPTISRPLPPPPSTTSPPPQSRPSHHRLPLPPTPGSSTQQYPNQQYYSQPSESSPNKTYDYYEKEQLNDNRRNQTPAHNPIEVDAARYYVQPKSQPSLQHTPSTASSSNTSGGRSDNSHLESYQPNTPPPWSPGASFRSNSTLPSPSDQSNSPSHLRSARQQQSEYPAYNSGWNRVDSISSSRDGSSRKPSRAESGAISGYDRPKLEQEWDDRRVITQPVLNRNRSVVGNTMIGSENGQASASNHRGVPLPNLPIGDERKQSPTLYPQQINGPQRGAGSDLELPGRLYKSSSREATPRTSPHPHLNQQDFKDPGLFLHHQEASSPNMLSSSGQKKQQLQDENEEVEYCLLSTIALLLRDSIPRGVQIKGSVSYPFSFTGKDVVSTIQELLPEGVLAWTASLRSGELDAAGERRIALLIAKSLKSQLFFHEVDWGTGELEDGVDEVYMFLEDSLAGSADMQSRGGGQANDFDLELSMAAHGKKDVQRRTRRPVDGLDDLPTGVFTAMTQCYSPLCGKPPGSIKGASCYSSSCPRAKSNIINRNSLTNAPSQIDSKSGALMGNSHLAMAWADTVPKELLASIPKAEVKRQNAILECIQKEEEFLHDLELLETLFLARLEKPNPTTGDPPPIPIGIEREAFIQEVFSNHRELVSHIRRLVERLHVRQREENPIVHSIGDIFLDAALEWEGAFETNMTNFPLAKDRIIREASINPRFKDFLESCRREPACHRLPMDNFLQRATTRLPRYNLHFKSILQDTEASNPDRESLARAIEIVDEQCKLIQKGVAVTNVKVKIREYAYNLATKRNKAAVHMDLLNPERQLMHQGRVYRKPQMTDFEWQDLLAVLFDNYLVVTKTKKREEDDGASSKFILAKRPIPVEMIQLIGFNDASVSRSIGLSNLHFRSNSERDFRDLYPFTIGHIGGKMEPLTLYVPSKAERDEWKQKLEEAMGLRAAVQEANKVFESHIVSSDVFALPASGSLDPEKAPPGVDANSFHGVVTCAVPFQTMDGRRLIAIGCADGVWIGLRNDPRSLRKVLHLKLVSQCAVLESFGIFVVLADKVLISYSLEALVPGSASSHSNPRPPQKLSGNRDVLFFSVGQLRERTLLVYMKKKSNESVFRALEPVVSNTQTQNNKSHGGGLFGKFSKEAKSTEWFRFYKSFFIPSEAYSMQFLRSKLVIVCARGFEIIDLDTLLPGTIPDFSQSARDDPRIQQLAKRVETAKPLGMFKNSESEFLLCYDAFACYVDRLGEPIRLDNVIEWEGVPRSVAFRAPFILAFDQRFIEVRDSSSGQLVQLIRTNDLRNISGSSTTVSSMEDEDDDAILLVQRVKNTHLMKGAGQRLPPFDLQQVFQLVSTAYYRQARLQGGLMRDEYGGSFRTTDLSRTTTTATYRTFASNTTGGPSGKGWI